MPPGSLLGRNTAKAFSPCKLLSKKKSSLRPVSSAQGPSAKPTSPDDKPKGSAGASNQKAAPEKPRDDAKASVAAKSPAAGKEVAPTPPQMQPAKQAQPAVDRQIASKANARPQFPSPKAGAWDQGAAGDWGPVENKPDFVGVFFKGTLHFRPNTHDNCQEGFLHQQLKSNFCQTAADHDLVAANELHFAWYVCRYLHQWHLYHRSLSADHSSVQDNR